MEWRPIGTLVYDERKILVWLDGDYAIAVAYDPKKTLDHYFFSRITHYAELPPKP